MVEHDAARLDAVFHALADSTRRRMLRSLRGQPRSVGELAAPFRISLAAASKHIKVLERAGLVTRQILGRTHLCHLQPQALAEGEARATNFLQRRYERADEPFARLNAALAREGIRSP